MITQARLHELLRYSPNTGEFFWNVSRRNRVRRGDRAGHLCSDGYWKITVEGRSYSVHRLAWLYVHGTWPEEQLDHKNAESTFNAIENLRRATPAQNQANARLRRDNTTGFKGVSFHKTNRKYVAQIKINGRKKCLGYFAAPEEAHAAYAAAATKHFGEFARL